MERIEKVELIREKCGVSYADAREALDACEDDVLDAIVWLEKRGKCAASTASSSTATSSEPQDARAEMVEAQARYEESAESMWTTLKRLLRKSIDTKFVATRHGETMLNIPVLVPILGVFLWGATIWLLIIGLFLDVRYRIEGARSVTVDINNVMDKAADTADKIKKDVKEGD